MNIQWEESQKRFLIENCRKLKDREIAGAIGKSVDSVRKMRQKLGFRKAPGRGKCELDKLS